MSVFLAGDAVEMLNGKVTFITNLMKHQPFSTLRFLDRSDRSFNSRTSISLGYHLQALS